MKINFSQFLIVSISFVFFSLALPVRADLNRGLVGYWSFNEGAGGKAYDSSGNKNTGSFPGGTANPTWTNGRLGRALSFDGSNDVVSVNTISWAIDQPKSVSVWFKTSTKNTAIITQGSTIYFFIRSDTGSFRSFMGGTGRDFGNEPLNTGTWHHLVWIYNGAFESAYLDGVSLGGQPNESDPASSGALNIGGVSGSFFNGLIDEVRIYNRALSAAEVAALYQSGAVKFNAPNNKGLMGYWSMNEGTSTVALDYSGNGNKGTLTNGPTWVSGKLGKALSFDGSNDYVSVPDADALDIGVSSPYTISLWFKLNSTWGAGSADQPLIQKRLNSGTFEGWQFMLYIGCGDNGLIIVHDSGPGLECSGTGVRTFNGGRWYHVVAKWNGLDTLVFYIDGVQIVSTSHTVSSTANNETLNIGRNVTATPDTFFNGLIDEVRIYNRALTAAEVAALYQSGAVKFNAPNNKGLMGYWSMNEGTSTVALDYSGNGNKGTLTNGPTWVSGKLGKALSFDGSNDYVSVPDADIFDLQSSYTISVWFKLNADWSVTSATQPLVDKRLAVSDFSGWQFMICGSDFCSSGYDGLTICNDPGVASGNCKGLDITIKAGVWNHVVATWNGVTYVSYFNGNQHQSTAISEVPNPNSQNLEIGRITAFTPDKYLNGLIDEVRIYNRALSASEVSALYRSGAVKLR